MAPSFCRIEAEAAAREARGEPPLRYTQSQLDQWIHVEKPQVFTFASLCFA